MDKKPRKELELDEVVDATSNPSAVIAGAPKSRDQPGSPTSTLAVDTASSEVSISYER